MRKSLSIGLLLLASSALFAQGQPAGDLKRTEESTYGNMADGTPIKLFILRNHNGMTFKVMAFGGTMLEISAPDKDGKFANCVSAPPTPQPRFGTYAQTIGRVANRIAGGKFTVDGKDYQLQTNDGANTLHSGTQANFGARLWEGKLLPEKEHETSAQLTMVSKDGDGGFPGNMTVNVTYTLTDDNEVRLDYEATTDKACPINTTNHAYFNLNGTASVLDDELWIDADQYTPVTRGIPNGQDVPVKDTPMDFTKPTKVGARIAQVQNYDFNFVINNWKPGDVIAGGGKSGVKLVARVTDPVSGRVMEVKTDQPGVQLYTGNNHPQNAVCLETQHFPDSVHHDNFPSIILKPGETFKTTTIFAFSVKK